METIGIFQNLPIDVQELRAHADSSSMIKNGHFRVVYIIS